MADVEYRDYKIRVKNAINRIGYSVLEEAIGELESQVKRNTAVDTGQTKNSWEHEVTKTDDGFTATLGSPLENAIWEEFGTGEYALNGDGRKGQWVYKDRKGNWHTTTGKQARRPLHRAYTTKRNKIIKYIQDRFKREIGS